MAEPDPAPADQAAAAEPGEAEAPIAEPEAPAVERFTISLDREEGDAWVFPALIERPAEPNGCAVMLLGGGLLTDLDWTLPGSYVDEQGQTVHMTIDGEPTRDAATLAAALLDAGFVVLRYGSIREGDPQHAANPAMGEPMPFDGTLALARRAWGELVERGGVGADRVAVLGHSLGATRGVLASEGKAGAYVLLAGARMSRSAQRPSEVAAEVAQHTQGMDADASGEVTLQEFRKWVRTGRNGTTFFGSRGLLGLDVDKDKTLRPWELCAAWVGRPGSEAPRERTNQAESWPMSVLESSSAPVLALWGEHDLMSMHGPALNKALGPRVTTVYLEDLGHNLAREQDGRTGPIDPAVVERIVEWLGSWCADVAEDTGADPQAGEG
jgi:pimeloyl-ACP methyl ester carboxylesterase